MAKQKIIRWRQNGNMVIEGVPALRHPGDEDLMNINEARNLEACGILEIIGDPDSVPEASVIMPEQRRMDPDDRDDFLDRTWQKGQDT